jgi:PAS domain S-box-containing protein
MGIDRDENLLAATAELRRRAEERLGENKGTKRLIGTEEDSRLLHELQVHQIELEMQNEELCRSRDEVETTLEKYTDLYDFAPVGYFTLDRNGAIRAVNLSGATLLSIERSLLLGRRFGHFVAVESRPAFTAFLGKVFTSPAKEACEVELLKGSNHPLFVHVEAVTAASGEECLVAIIDISVRRQLEEKLEILHTDLAARSAELEAANIELEAFSFSVSHDLRSPLTAINGYCQVIQKLCGNSLDEQSRGYIQQIFDGTLRMSRLIDTLLNFSRVTRIELSNDKIDLSKMAEEVALELKMSGPERRVTFRIAAGITAFGDTVLVRVVLDNLIGNAWKYTGSREGAVIEFGVTEVQGKPACFVRDNGPGFDMAIADKLFIPFQRLPGNAVEGNGIGLATVERIVRRHGGRIWAESKQGEGATFYFILK